MFRYIFGIPGEENLDILDSLRSSKIKLEVARHEQVVGFMAATVNRFTGKVGCCLSTLGLGAINFATAAAYAQLARFPMVTTIKLYMFFSICLFIYFFTFLFGNTLRLLDAKAPMLATNLKSITLWIFFCLFLNFFGWCK
jgi:hypothetical protein